MTKPKTIFSIDYGDTIGFSIIDNEFNLLLCGYTLNPIIVLDQLELFLQTYNNKLVGIEIQIGEMKETYTKFINEVRIKCASFTTDLIEINPSVWKNSPSIRFRPKLIKHSVDSAKIGHYILRQSN